MTALAHKPNRIARRLIVAVVLFSSFITLITSAFQLYRGFNQDIQMIEGRLSLVETVHLETLSDSVWNSDRVNLLQQLHSIINIPDMQYLEVREADVFVASAGVPDRTRAIVRVYPLLREYRGKQLKIGELGVHASINSAYEHVYAQAWNILIANAIKTFLVTGFILYVFHNMVTRHLFRIAEYAGRLTVSNIDDKLILDKAKHLDQEIDEVDVVVLGFEKMQINIGETIESLHERETFIRLILDSTAEAIYGLDKHGRCSFVNKACVRMLGYERESDLLDRKMHQVIQHTYLNGDAYPEIESKINKAINEGVQTHVDNEVLWRQDGSSFPAEYWSYPIFESGEVSGAVVTFLDISRRQKFLKQQGRLVSVIENASDFMGVMDLNGQFVFLNVAGKQLLRLGSIKTLDHVKIFNIVEECGREKFWTAVRSEIDKVGNWSGECHLVTVVDRAVVPVIMDIVYIDDNINVKPTQMAVVIRDMTEIKAAQDEIKRHRDTLEETVEERTAELKNIVQELETFSYSVSHDLRTPLRAIDGFSLALLEDYSSKLDATGLDYLHKVRNAAQRMASLIDDLLLLSRVTRLEMKKNELNLSILVSDIANNLNEKYRNHNVKVCVADNVLVHGDNGLLRIALENLMDNAWKYTARVSEPKMSFSVFSQDGGLVYRIQDNGVGFDMDYQHKLFGPFQRLHKDDEFEGTGIGLATVQRVIRRHNGEIWADSELNNGASFYFTLSA